MTDPVEENGHNQTNPSPTVPIVILGTDAILAALPATPVQLAHACLRAGFANVIPVSWGDELIAAAMLRHLAPHEGPAVQCSCPKVAHRLLSVGSDLRPVMVPLVSPPVATARYIRSVSQPTRTRITYVGACPGAVDDSIDIRMTPDALLAMLADREISPAVQPRVFEGVIPPDRRRFRSQPGGLPAPDALWAEDGARTLVEIEGEDIAAEIAQHILSGKTVLIDVSTRLGCVCAGALNGVDPTEARELVIANEPPRATTPVVNELEPIDLDLPLPAAPRAPIDIVATSDAVGGIPPTSPRPFDAHAHAPTTPHAPPASPTHLAAQSPAAQPPPHPPHQAPRISPTPGVPTIADPRPGRTTPAATPRPVIGSIPIARGADGRALPRAYVARRRSSPRSTEAVASSQVETPAATPPDAEPEETSVPGPERTSAIFEAEQARILETEATSPSENSSLEKNERPPLDAETPPLRHEPPLAPTPPAPVHVHEESPLAFTPPLATRRSLWLAILLIIAAMAGVGIGVVIAHSLGVGSAPPAASR